MHQGLETVVGQCNTMLIMSAVVLIMQYLFLQHTL